MPFTRAGSFSHEKYSIKIDYETQSEVVSRNADDLESLESRENGNSHEVQAAEIIAELKHLANLISKQSSPVAETISSQDAKIAEIRGGLQRLEDLTSKQSSPIAEAISGQDAKIAEIQKGLQRIEASMNAQNKRVSEVIKAINNHAAWIKRLDARLKHIEDSTPKQNPSGAESPESPDSNIKEILDRMQRLENESKAGLARVLVDVLDLRLDKFWESPDEYYRRPFGDAEAPDVGILMNKLYRHRVVYSYELEGFRYQGDQDQALIYRRDNEVLIIQYKYLNGSDVVKEEDVIRLHDTAQTYASEHHVNTRVILRASTRLTDQARQRADECGINWLIVPEGGRFPSVKCIAGKFYLPFDSDYFDVFLGSGADDKYLGTAAEAAKAGFTYAHENSRATINISAH